MKKQPASKSLSSVVGRELESVGSLLELVLRNYKKRIQSNLGAVQKAVEQLEAKDLKARDLRDMLMLIRQLEVKPNKAKRRDLKRLESLVEDLQAFVRDWEMT